MYDDNVRLDLKDKFTMYYDWYDALFCQLILNCGLSFQIGKKLQKDRDT